MICVPISFENSVISSSFSNAVYPSFIKLKSGGNAGLSIWIGIVSIAPTSFAYKDASNADIVNPYPVTGVHKISAL